MQTSRIGSEVYSWGYYGVFYKFHIESSEKINRKVTTNDVLIELARNKLRDSVIIISFIDSFES